MDTGITSGFWSSQENIFENGQGVSQISLFSNETNRKFIYSIYYFYVK